SAAERAATATAVLGELTRSGAPQPFARRAAGPDLFVAAGVAALVAGYLLLARRSATLSSDEPGLSIAVLEFKNVGGDSANRPFSYGMSEELSTALGKVE